VRIGRKASTPIRLERGKLLDAAAWSRARELGQALFGCKLPPAHRSLQTQDGYCTELKELGVEHRQALQGLHTLLAGFEVEEGARAQDVKEANARLAPLAREGSDSFDLLTELLAKWPDDGDDPLRKLVMEAATLRDAVSEIDETARTNLRAGVKHAEHGQSVREHLDKLDRLLSSRDHERPLTKSGAAEWNRQAQEWVHKLIEIIYEPTPTPTPDPTEKMPTSVLVRDREKLDLGDPDAVGLFVGALRTDLTALGADLVRVDVIVHPEPEK